MIIIARMRPAEVLVLRARVDWTTSTDRCRKPESLNVRSVTHQACPRGDISRGTHVREVVRRVPSMHTMAAGTQLKRDAPGGHGEMNADRSCRRLSHANNPRLGLFTINIQFPFSHASSTIVSIPSPISPD
jgi:hypothetical protein